MSELKLLHVPSAFRRAFDGMCQITHNKENFIVAWYDRNVLFLPATVSDSACRVFIVKSSVQSVFQSDKCIFCLDESGWIYTFSCIKNEEDVDIFSSDDEFSSTTMETSFVPSILVKNAVCINALCFGFVVLRHDLGKLYVELYNVISNNGDIKQMSCVELCIINEMFTKGCTLQVCRSESMTPELRQLFVKMLCGNEVDVMFIALANGYVYSIVVSSKTGTFLSKPKLIYTCSYSVLGIVCLEDEQKLFSKIGIILAHGIVVIISPDVVGDLVQYEVANLPSYPRIIMEIGNSLIFGNGLNLWHCTLRTNNVLADCKMLNVKGVYLISKHSGSNKILVATVHHTFYELSLVSSSSNMSTSTCQFSVNEISQSLYKELCQLEICKKKIAFEEDLISAMSLTSRSAIWRNFFSDLITVQTVSSLSVEQFVLMHSDNSDFENVMKGKQPLSNLFLINIVIENKSDIEFSPLIWSVNISATTGGITTQKCTKLARSFSNSVNLSFSLCVHIEKPFLGVSVSVSLVRDLPECSQLNTGMPWLIIPVVVRNLDIGYFFKPSFVKDLSSNNETLTEKILCLAQKNNPKLNKSMIRHFEKPILSQTYYTYEFSVCNDAELIDLWSLIQKICSCEFTTGQTRDVNRNNSHESKLCVYAGNMSVEFILCSKSVQVASQNPPLLNAAKNIIIRKWMSHSDLVSSIPVADGTVARAMLYKEKLQVEKMNHNISEFTVFKIAWRHFVSENICF